MSEKKYQVFISSTYNDLIEERRDIARSVLDLGHIPAAMEHFPAMDEEQLEYIKQIVDECDYYVLVIAGKYGSVNSSGISYTELEYDYAVEKQKIVLGFPIHDWTVLPQNRTESDPDARAKLEAFRRKLSTGRLIKAWQDRKDLDAVVVKALTAAFKRYPQEGWVRTPKKSSEELLSELNETRKLNSELSQQIDSLRAEPKQVIEDLIGLNGSYTYNITTDHAYSWDNERIFRLTSTWLEILLAFGFCLKPKLQRGPAQAMVGRRLYSIRQNGGRDVPDVTAVSLDGGNFEQMIVQLEALGYILEDGDGLALSAAGRLLYQKEIAIRSGR